MPRDAQTGYNERELDRARRAADEIRQADLCPDCHHTDGRHTHGCPTSTGPQQMEGPDA